jgi:hypothetical protein
MERRSSPPANPQLSFGFQNPRNPPDFLAEVIEVFIHSRGDIGTAGLLIQINDLRGPLS